MLGLCVLLSLSSRGVDGSCGGVGNRDQCNDHGVCVGNAFFHSHQGFHDKCKCDTCYQGYDCSMNICLFFSVPFLLCCGCICCAIVANAVSAVGAMMPCFVGVAGMGYLFNQHSNRDNQSRNVQMRQVDPQAPQMHPQYAQQQGAMPLMPQAMPQMAMQQQGIPQAPQMAMQQQMAMTQAMPQGKASAYGSASAYGHTQGIPQGMPPPMPQVAMPQMAMPQGIQMQHGMQQAPQMAMPQDRPLKTSARVETLKRRVSPKPTAPRGNGVSPDNAPMGIPTETTMFQVQVPDNVWPGDAIQVQTPTGQKMQTVVPKGLKPGDAFNVQF